MGSSPRVEALSTNFSNLGISQFGNANKMRWKIGKSLLVRRRKAALPPLSLPSPSTVQQRIADPPSAVPSTPHMAIAVLQRSPSFSVPVSVHGPTCRGADVKKSPLLGGRIEDQHGSRS